MEGQMPVPPPPIDLNHSVTPANDKRSISPMIIILVGGTILILIVGAIMVLTGQRKNSEDIIKIEKQQKIPDGSPTPIPSITIQPLSQEDIKEVQNIDLGDINADLRDIEQEIESL